MNSKTYRCIASLAILSAFAVPVQAGWFSLEFSVSGFNGMTAGSPAPADPAYGTIIFEADSIHSPVQAFYSINLTLDGHAYLLDEIGFDPSGNRYTIGGSLNDVDQMRTLTDDFFVEWDGTDLSPTAFAYSSSRHSGIWDSRTAPADFTIFNITPVPEPSSTSLLVGGLIGFGLLRRRVAAQVG